MKGQVMHAVIMTVREGGGSQLTKTIAVADGHSQSHRYLLAVMPVLQKMGYETHLLYQPGMPQGWQNMLVNAWRADQHVQVFADRAVFDPGADPRTMPNHEALLAAKVVAQNEEEALLSRAANPHDILNI